MSRDCDCTLFISHIFDEACMRVRSYIAGPGADVRRARYSKIMNHVINIHSSNACLEWFQDLQALQRKDGPTIASALINIATNILDTLLEGRPPGQASTALRVIHIFVGDAI